MDASGERKYFIVQHGLDALKALPTFVWRTGLGPRKVPHRFNQVEPGHRWIAFAFTPTDHRENRLSLVTGFCQCTEKACYRSVPHQARRASGGFENAWMIEGKFCGPQPAREVGVPPLPDLLGRPVWTNQAIVPITANDFERIRSRVLNDRFNARKVPLLGREPETEQELLAVVVHRHKALGIERILRIRKAFPDLLVKLEGRRDEVHLELELYSSGFIAHGHCDQVSNSCFDADGRPVAVLCWIDNDGRQSQPRVPKLVNNHVFELRSLISSGTKIGW